MNHIERNARLNRVWNEIQEMHEVGIYAGATLDEARPELKKVSDADLREKDACEIADAIWISIGGSF